jgi:signal transduction histidine kinase/CheY-like chemotaxis protein
MAVGIALLSTIILMAIHISEYIHNGLVFILIPIALCAVLLAAGIPLMGYLKKTWKGASEAGYFQAANLFAIFSMVSFVFIRLPEYIRFAQYSRVAVLLIACFLVIAGMFVLMIRIKTAAPLAFYIPALTFTCYTVGTLVMGGNTYYFLIYLVICGFGSMYNHYRGYRNFVVLSHLAILCMILLGLPFNGSEMSRNDVILDWLIAAYVTVFLLMLSRFSAEKSDRSSRAQDTFVTLMTATPNLLAMLDQLNRVTYISKPLAELTHIEDHEMVAGRPVIDLFPDIDMKLVIGEILETDGFYDSTVELILHGKKRYFRIISATLPGSGHGRFIDMSDITPLFEARLEAEEAKARAEDANSAKSAFLARMSHEIRTPMNAIIGMSELALRKELAADVRGDIQDIKHAGANLISIINDLLDFSKIEAGRLEIIQARYLLSSLINDTVSIIHTRIMEKPIRFYTNIDSRIPNELYGDEVRLRQILLNLLGNAVKYTERGFLGLSIVEARPREGNRVYLAISISDSGLGIKTEDQGSLFGEFVRMDAAKNRGIEGTGLGLAITKRLCVAMGGDITVESEYGRGSTFTVTIPQGFDSDSPFALVDNPGEKKTLVFERREISANSVGWSLRNLGVPFTLTTDQEAFAQALRREDWYFVFTGYGLYERIRPLIEGMEKKPQLALMIEWENRTLIPGVRYVSLPVQSLSIADVLNGAPDRKGYYGYDGESTGTRFTAPNARLLVVDDIATNLKVAEGLLAPYQVKIDTSLSGADAVEQVKRRAYDIVFMDHMMPEMDGIEAVALIRAWEQEAGSRRIPIAALTANAISGMKEMFLEKGFDDFLSKPIDVSKLDELMGRWIPKDKREKTGTRPEETQKEAIKKEETLPVIPGVDTAKGLSFCGGKVSGYKKVLSLFRRDTKERIALLQGFLDKSIAGEPRQNPEQDFATFNTQVHTLKSVLGSIGASELSAEAAALETAGKAEDLAAIKGSLPGFVTHLDALVERIGAALETVNALARL